MGTMGNLSMGHMGKMAMGGKKGGKITSYTHSPAVIVSPLICFFIIHTGQRAWKGKIGKLGREIEQGQDRTGKEKETESDCHWA